MKGNLGLVSISIKSRITNKISGNSLFFNEKHLVIFLISILYLLCYYSCPTFSPLPPSAEYPQSLQQSPPQFMSMGGTYEFFSFSISYTIFNLHLSILYLPFYASYSLYLVPHSPPSPSPLIALHVISISMFLFLFQLPGKYMALPLTKQQVC